jgi:hypothetical protein
VNLRHHKTDLGRSVRTERFTFLEWPDGSTQLYDYATDPKEYLNLAKDERHAATVAFLRQWLHTGWQAAQPAAP